MLYKLLTLASFLALCGNSRGNQAQQQFQGKQVQPQQPQPVQGQPVQPAQNRQGVQAQPVQVQPQGMGSQKQAGAQEAPPGWDRNPDKSPGQDKQQKMPQANPVDPSNQPNVLFILLDDLGWADISARGGQFATPNIDSLYKGSIVLQRHYIHMMCSPSRTQYITGRYAMYQGINKMTPWDYTEIGGIPIGQPTMAQWLKNIGGYRCYGVGKWHMGYAFDGLMPLHRGFDHWYGFMQGAVNYVTKLYDDIKYGPTDFYDFWYNDEIDYSADGVNSMYQYTSRFEEILWEHYQRYNDDPFFIFAPLQAIHGPLRKVDEFAEDCVSILGENAPEDRKRYCENTILMDQEIGEMIYKLKEMGDWDNTLVVFGTDNGANLDNQGSNHPLRGTKGTLFDGNIRTLQFVTGGLVDKYVDKEDLSKNERYGLASNLDWTPTILDFVGLLDHIPENQRTWDGVSQKDMILFGDEHKVRDHIVLNVGLENLDSCSVIWEHHDGSLYKYLTSSDDTIDRWSWYRVNGWAEFDPKMGFYVDEEGAEEDEDVSEYLYELVSDEREKHNLLKGAKGEYREILNVAMNHVKPYVQHELYSERIDCLWHRVPLGDPTNLGDGRSVVPFLDRHSYLAHIEQCFEDDAQNGKRHPRAKMDLYLNEWEVPKIPELAAYWQRRQASDAKYEATLKQNQRQQPQAQPQPPQPQPPQKGAAQPVQPAPPVQGRQAQSPQIPAAPQPPQNQQQGQPQPPAPPAPPAGGAPPGQPAPRPGGHTKSKKKQSNLFPVIFMMISAALMLPAMAWYVYSTIMHPSSKRSYEYTALNPRSENDLRGVQRTYRSMS